ncbi:hypothetical protein B0H21DRAFT_692161 [Amylocystis lapponica]|nr:hypothetical protein B0H21DRAFT_692161 [Amylocystis lapponica]
MQSPSPTHTTSYILRAPQSVLHAYDTQARFSVGYALYNHEVPLAAEPPATLTYATGATAAQLSYAAPSSVELPYSALARPAVWNNASSDKSPGPSWYSTLNHPPLDMTVPYSSLPVTEDSQTAASTESVDYRASNAGSSSPEPLPAGSDTNETLVDNKGKKHACWMCHKSFDRPSTLKKHLLVHTGEKAFACETCGRRFGVASNLNRHAKRCALRPVILTASAKAAAAAGASAGASSPTQAVCARAETSFSATAAAVSTVFSSDPSTSAPASTRGRKRKAAPSEDSTASSSTAPKKTKRVRRAPSPSRWIPESLKTFDLTLSNKGTPTPLPPVRPFHDNTIWEERDSYDENVTARPYHPEGWRNRLPGPGLMGKDVVNTSGGNLLIF